MFGRWLFVRIRAAERALQAGRVDDAYAAAVQPDVREPRRGRKLLDELVRPLLARARLHLQAGRYQDALNDLDKLKAIGRSGPDAEELRQRAVQQMYHKHRRDADEQEAYDRAAANLQAGRLESGRLAVERVDDSRRREDLRDQLDVRVKRSAQLLAQAGDALNRGEVLTALGFWEEALQRHGRSQASDELGAQLGTACRNSFDEWFADGRLERLLTMRGGLASLRQFVPGLDEYEQIAALCSRGAAQLGRRDYAGLRETLLRLRAARGKVGWLDKALGALRRITESLDVLLASPLGLFASSAGRPDPDAPTLVAGDQPVREAGGATPVTAAADPTAAPLDRRALLLLVDGAGSYLLVSQDTVRIGRAGGRGEIDVPIPASGVQSHHADVIRDGDDYFLAAHGPVRVNGRDVKRTLLRDGDRIVLGSKAKFVFRQPSTRSATAVLKLSHRCRLPQDVSEVILFCDTCLIGRQSSCHIRTQESDTQVVLFDRGGRLHGRETVRGGGKLGDARPLALGATHDFGEVRVTVKQYSLGNGKTG